MKQNTLILILLFLPFIGFTQDGSPDLSFGDNGIVETDLDGGEDYTYAVAQSNNGRIVLVGNSYNFNTNESNNFIIVYLESGDLDSSFGNDGVILIESDGDEFIDVDIQTDEKLLVGSGSGQEYIISRFLEDGTIDISFGDNGILTPFFSGGTFRDLILLEDDKLLISGTMNIEGINQATLKQYLSNGSIDTSFGNNGIMNYLIGNESNYMSGRTQVMENGNIILTNQIINSSISSNVIMKCLPNGSLDSSFGTNGIATIPVSEEYNCSPWVFTDGSLLASCAYYDTQNEVVIRTTLKLTSNDGVLDTNFANGGYLNGYTVSTIQANQRIIVNNSFMDWEGGISIYLSRLYANGASDPSFQFQSNYNELSTYKLNVQNSGKILIAGSSIWYNGNTDIVLQQFHNNPLGVEDHQFPNFTLYPNPSKGLFNLNHDFITSETLYQITDITGKIIQSGILSGEQTDLNLSNVQSGVYLLTASGSTFRLVKN